MSDLRKAAEMALEALDYHFDNEDDYLNWKYPLVLEAKQALRQALAQPEQKPVAWLSKCFNEDGDPLGYTAHEQEVHGSFPVYTSPREWVGLTDEEIAKADCVAMDYVGAGDYGLAEETIFDFAKAIEAKLKEKNT
jgi:hypothetical protein